MRPPEPVKVTRWQCPGCKQLHEHPTRALQCSATCEADRKAKAEAKRRAGEAAKPMPTLLFGQPKKGMGGGI